MADYNKIINKNISVEVFLTVDLRLHTHIDIDLISNTLQYSTTAVFKTLPHYG